MKMYLFESNSGNMEIESFSFTQLLVIAENRKKALEIAIGHGIDFSEMVDYYNYPKWNYPIYDFETLYTMLYNKNKKTDFNKIYLKKEDEENVIGKFDKLFRNGFFTITKEPIINEVEDGYELYAEVLPFNAFYKLLALSYKKGEKIVMSINGEGIEKFKVQKVRNAIYPMNIKNENSLPVIKEVDVMDNIIILEEENKKTVSN